MCFWLNLPHHIGYMKCCLLLDHKHAHNEHFGRSTVINMTQVRYCQDAYGKFPVLNIRIRWSSAYRQVTACCKLSFTLQVSPALLLSTLERKYVISSQILELVFTFTPTAYPSWQAMWRGVDKFCWSPSGEAPACSRVMELSVSQFFTAQNKGVWPLQSTTSTEDPCSSSSATQFAWWSAGSEINWKWKL